MSNPLGSPKPYTKKSPEEVEAWNVRRRLIFKHNSFFGHAMMAAKAMNVILDSETATPEAKAEAYNLQQSARRLYELLKTRVDS